MRVLCALLLFLCVANAAKIVSVTPFGDTKLKIVFQEPVSQSLFQIKKIDASRDFVDFDGVVIPFIKKKYFFQKNLSVVIAQNTSKRVRIVISGNKKTSYQIRVEGKILYISFVDNVPLLQEKNNKNNLSVKNSLKKTSQSQNVILSLSTNSKKTLESTVINDSMEKQNSKRIYRIVIDPGHGGKDCGAMGVNKICEKVIVLNVAKILESELKKRGYIVYMTRSSDIYINLKRRTEMANLKNASLFISIHANSVEKNVSTKAARGVETYFLSTARSKRAKNVAEQENKGDVETMNYFSKLSFLNTLNSHRLIASNKLAIDIQSGILRELRKQYDEVVDGGVREGPFWVLAGALMPSVLIEIGYNSSEMESKRLNDKEYQKYLAFGIANGVDGFVAKNF